MYNVDTNIAEYAYDALGRRIERVDAVAGVTTCFYYDDQRVILESETRPEGLEQRVFVYGNYIDETLVMRRLIPGGSGWTSSTAMTTWSARRHCLAPSEPCWSGMSTMPTERSA